MRTVRVSAPTASRPGPARDGADLSGGWRPHTWIGAPAPGGLALPPAHPTMAWLYAPRGVHLDDRYLIVADSGNHRVLIWHGVPGRDGTPADVVLGQPDGESEGPAAGGRGPEHGMHLPTGVLVHDGRLVVADAWHHRVLVWDRVPERSGQPPDLVLGQAGLDAAEPNRGGPCSATTLYWPYGVAVAGGWFYVADTGNRRVLGWAGGIPGSPDRPADVVLGQPGPAAREENRGEGVGPRSFRWPHDVAGTAGTLLVADAGDHRVLGWRPRPDADRDADLVLGQDDFHSAAEFPYAPQRPDRLRFPYALSADTAGGAGPGGPVPLAVADTANNRVLLWEDATRGGPADAVLGQPTFADNGENRWSAVAHDTLCWPYGLCRSGDRLAVADSGNNRVVIWRRA